MADVPPASRTQRLAWEKELLGLYVTDHPLKEHVNVLASKGYNPIEEIMQEQNEKKLLKTYGVITKIQRFSTKKGDTMLFAKIEDEQHEGRPRFAIRNAEERNSKTGQEQDHHDRKNRPTLAR